MEGVRQERANSEVIKALSNIIRNNINDPRIKNAFITLTYVKLSADFRHCKVGVSVLDSGKKAIVDLLNKCEGHIKRELLNIVKLPYAPKLEFILDSGEDNSERINKILNELNIPHIDEENNDYF